MNVLFFYRAAAYLTGRKAVWLRDLDDEVVLRLARETSFGLVAKRIIYRVLLHPDGTVTGNSYTKEWRYA